MSAMNATVRLQNVEVFADRDLRRVELFRKIANQHTSVTV
jgi:hypothetical protein